MLKFIGTTAFATLLLATAAHAATAHKELEVQSSFEVADALKGQDYLKVAMNAPMLDLLKSAQVTNPQAMLEYGLALELGRPSASGALDKDDKEKLKRGYRGMLDMYLNSGDKFSGVKFDEDSMLDVPDFWITLAEHIGRPKDRVDMSVIDASGAGNTPPGMASSTLMTYIPDDQQTQEFNLGHDLVLNRQVVNASWACAQSAQSFAKLKKTQVLDISETKLTPAQFASAMTRVVADYRTAYQEGVLACGSRDFFFKAADIASGNLGKLGALKEDPNLKPAPLADGSAQ